MADITFEARPPEEAVAYLENKAVGGRFSFDWRDTWKDEHVNAFVVAKATSADVLADIHGAMLAAIKEGKTSEDFIRDLTPTLQARGWWGRKRVVDPVTGVEKLVTLGTPRRLRVIYDTNMRMAHSAGRWARIMASAATRPYLQYRHTRQADPRPEHLAWDKIILPVTHDFWRTHYCPNGWGCKCYVVSLRRAEKVTSEDELTARGVYRTRPWTNKRTGEVELVPEGIDKGFDYNVGRARLAALSPPAMPEPVRDRVVGDRLPRALPPPPVPRRLPDDVSVRPEIEGDPDQVFDAVAKVLGVGEGEVYVDRAQVPLVLGKRMFEQHDAGGASIGPKPGLAARSALAEIFAATIRDPDEIWHSFQIRADGASVLVRNLVAAFDVPEAGRQWFVVTFHEGANRGVWMGVTAYGPGKVNRPGTQEAFTAKGHRIGTLVYRRK